MAFTKLIIEMARFMRNVALKFNRHVSNYYCTIYGSRYDELLMRDSIIIRQKAFILIRMRIKC